MKTTRFVALAGTAVCIALAGTAMGQTPSAAPRPAQPSSPAPAAQPTPSQPTTTNPTTTQPTNPATTPPTNPATTQPGTGTNGTTTTQPGQTTTTQQGVNATLNQRQRRLFQLENQQSVGQLNDFGQRVVRIEANLQASNQRLLRMLGQARQLQGDRRFDAFGEVLQGILQEQANMSQYLVDLRTALTGDLANASDAAGSSSATGQNGTNTTTAPDPNQVPRLNPGSPTTNPKTTNPPADVPIQPNSTPAPSTTPRQNPGSPTTNPSTAPGTPR